MVIEVLNNADLNVLCIYDKHNKKETERYYVTTDFRQASEHTHKHILDGIDITDLIKENSLTTNRHSSHDSVTDLLKKIDKLPNSKIEYSPDFSFIWYIP